MASVGPTLVAGGAIYLGPELSFGVVQQMRVRKTNGRVGLVVRGVIAPLFALNVPDASPGYMGQLVFGLAAGRP